jgi:SPOR domain
VSDPTSKPKQSRRIFVCYDAVTALPERFCQYASVRVSRGLQVSRSGVYRRIDGLSFRRKVDSRSAISLAAADRFPTKGFCRVHRTAGSRNMLAEASAVNNDVQRNLVTFIASSLFAAMVVGTASAHSPHGTAGDAKVTLETKTSDGATEDTDSDVRAGDDLNPLKQNRPSSLADYAYSEVPPDNKPADIVLDLLKDVPVGTPVEEIKRASDAFDLNFNFMRAVARIESDFDPKQRTGSYFGLFQLSKDEFAKYGSGDIFDARDNAVAAAYKFATAATLFELNTHKKPTFSDLYLIHQQGTQGAEEHVNHPDRIAWKSMCATDEGREKGENWCKRAIWKNTLPEIKHIWKSVDNLPSGVFLNMWQNQVDRFYAYYSGVQNTGAETSNSVTAEPDHTQSFASTSAQLFSSGQRERPRAESLNGPAMAEAPWGVQLFGGSSQISVLASYHQLQRKYPTVLGSRQPLVIRSQAGRNASWYRVRITAQTLAEAQLLCGTLRQGGGSCLVQRN